MEKISCNQLAKRRGHAHVPLVLGTINLPQPLSDLRKSPIPTEAQTLNELKNQILAHACSIWDQKLVKTVQNHKTTLGTLDQYVSPEVIKEPEAREFLISLQLLSEILAIKKEHKFKRTPEYLALLVTQLLQLRKKFLAMKMRYLEDALFKTQNSTDARDLYKTSKAFSKVCQLPDALIKIIRLAKFPQRDQSVVLKNSILYIYLFSIQSLYHKPLMFGGNALRPWGVKGFLPK